MGEEVIDEHSTLLCCDALSGIIDNWNECRVSSIEGFIRQFKECCEAFEGKASGCDSPLTIQMRHAE